MQARVDCLPYPPWHYNCVSEDIVIGNVSNSWVQIKKSANSLQHLSTNTFFLFCIPYSSTCRHEILHVFRQKPPLILPWHNLGPCTLRATSCTAHNLWELYSCALCNTSTKYGPDHTSRALQQDVSQGASSHQRKKGASPSPTCIKWLQHLPWTWVSLGKHIILIPKDKVIKKGKICTHSKERVVKSGKINCPFQSHVWKWY